MTDNNVINLSDTLYDKKPISWLIRELKKQSEQGNDYVEFRSKRVWGEIEYVLVCSS